MNIPEFREADYSRTTITELMIPSYANFGGKIHGGQILSLMDKVAYACSAKHAGGYCVTASVNVVDFLSPVDVGDLVSLLASVNYVGRSSLVIGVKVISENVTTGEVRHTNSSYFTMVAMDENREPRTVPGLVLRTKTDIRRFLEAIKRREIIHQYKKDFKHSMTNDEIETGISLLKDHRCKIELKNH